MNYCVLYATINVLVICTLWILVRWYYINDQPIQPKETQYIFMSPPITHNTPSYRVYDSTASAASAACASPAESPVFHRIGHLYGQTNNIYKPLLAKQIRRDLWQYYVLQGNQDSGFFPVAVLSQNRNCMDHNGCRQLSENDTVFIENENGTEYNVVLYDRLLNLRHTTNGWVQ